MAAARFSVSKVGKSLTWVVVDDARHRQLVASAPNYDCALMIAALMNGDMVQAVQRRDDLLKTNPPAGS
jgi:hypothetical protein